MRRHEVHMKRIVVTGAFGQLGLALRRLFMGTSYELFFTVRTVSADERMKALDITDEAAVFTFMDHVRPDVIINCAAFTAVDLCENEEEMAYRVNALGPKYLAMAAERVGAKLIHVSTDYVYDGQASVPYMEDSIPNPCSVYGKTKLAGDEFVLKYCKKSFVVRTAWVYGEGKNFVRTMLRLLENNKPIRVVSDQYGTPTSALELARTILFLMETESYGIYHATCEGSTTWYEFALTIFREAGKDAKVEPVSSAEYRTLAKRPAYSVLDNKALRERHGYVMKEWKEAFREYMREEE
jgi:dTDP-4-dehydrorhamnose reductase